LYIGHLGHGTLTVADGGKLLPGGSGPPQEFAVGINHRAKGTLVVDGASTSVVFSDHQLNVGFEGAGTFTVSGGALVHVKDCALGWQTSSSASALVTGKAPTGTESRLFVARLRVGGTPKVSVLATLDVGDPGHVKVDESLEIFEKGIVRLIGAGSILIGSGLEGPGECVVGVGGTLLHNGKLIGKRVRHGGTILGKMAPSSEPRSLSRFASAEAANVALSSRAAQPLADTSSGAVIDAELSMEVTATTIIEIAGPANSQQPALRVTGPVTLGGKLALQFLDGFAPAKGQKFRLFDFQSTITGQFAQVEVAGLARFQYELTRDAAGVYTLTALSDGVATSPPRLRVERAGLELIITWAETAIGYTLQSTSDLGSGNWQPRPATSNQARIPITDPAQFFRLIKP